MLIAFLTLSSCGERKEGTLTVFYSVSLSNDVLQMADLAITYKDGNGASVTDTISKTLWEKEIVLDSFPAEFGLVDYTFIPKPESGLKLNYYTPKAEFNIFTREAKFNESSVLGAEVPLVSREQVSDFLALVNDNQDKPILFTANKNDTLGFTVEQQ